MAKLPAVQRLDEGSSGGGEANIIVYRYSKGNFLRPAL